jgi:hypothetical protein
MTELLRLTEVVGRPVVSGAERIGRVVDLAASVSETTPPLTALLVGPRRRAAPVAVPAAAAERFGDPIVLRAGTEPDAAWRLGGHELLLVRDVLDVQIVDTAGKRLVRVGDVEIADEPDGPVVAGVEVGVGAVLRRLLLRRLAERAGIQTVAWEHLHVASGRGHQVLLDSRCAAVMRLGPEELADVVERLAVARAAEVLEARSPETAAAAMERTAPEVEAALRDHMRAGEEDA